MSEMREIGEAEMAQVEGGFGWLAAAGVAAVGFGIYAGGSWLVSNGYFQGINNTIQNLFNSAPAIGPTSYNDSGLYNSTGYGGWDNSYSNSWDNSYSNNWSDSYASNDFGYSDPYSDDSYDDSSSFSYDDSSSFAWG